MTTQTNPDDETTTKTFDLFLVIDWKNDSVRHRKTEPDDLAPTQLAIPVSIDVNVPEVTVPTIEAAIDVPAASVEQSVVQETRELADDRGLLEGADTDD
ncbi:hypothetical protein [Natrarchaeobius oligotrophus]|uniref:Uncharacterized protein n=1 Tax=Natrarchaeobius chitinivorans TaxID=1679083 RepID=A0A3N6LU10_NATCH|nr:hypothetical protein [Natrarchaeobius chitinivorans]RQG93708.1 hypothetical protein EA472_22495 [Natrarchaeobius chitinivorans]